ncbi:MAG: LysR family transcriptional regulator [Bacteriovorax sp.]|jgi:LysR family transcriptional activator of nhaA|nr:LysR family transcriptional regulator [Bacteriovorax sp.]
MKWLNYHHLIYFKEIATCGSISKASEKLLIGQPALSAQLKQLEEELQIELFERKNRKLLLTDAGKVVLKYANDISSLGQELLQVVEKKSYTTKITLKLGALDSIPKQIVWEIAQKARTLGDCFISIIEGPQEELTTELLNRNIDCFISNQSGNFSRDKNMSAQSFVKAPVSIYGTKEFLSCKKNFPKSLSGIPMILPTHDSKLRHDLDYFFDSKKIKVLSELETQDTSLMKIFASQSAGVAALPDIAALNLVRDKILYKLGTLPNIIEEYWVISSKRTIDNPIATKLLKSI